MSVRRRDRAVATYWAALPAWDIALRRLVVRRNSCEYTQPSRAGATRITPELMERVRREMPGDFSKRIPFFLRDRS